MAGLGDIRLAAGLACFAGVVLAVYGGPAGAKVSQAKQQPAAETAKQLVDVAAGTMPAGAGRVQTAADPSYAFSYARRYQGAQGAG